MNDDIKRALQFLFEPGDTVELCAIGPRVVQSRLWEGRAYGKKAIVAGWFDDHEKLASTALALDEQAKPDGIYLCLNPVTSALLGRANNRLIAGVGRTQDHEVIRRRTILVDVDPKRPAGISSTDEEKEAAYETILRVREWLFLQGWPEPLFADSGNGYHLIYRVDLPNDKNTADNLSGLLQALAAQFDTDKVAVDTSVFNAARLCKLYGTHARKGDSTTDRPHRLAGIISIPEEVTT